MLDVDVVIIGSGPGGYVAAIRLGQLGKKVVLIDKDRIGGECLNYGCIPSKVLISAGNMYSKMKSASEIGINVEGLNLDLRRLHEWKHSVIDKLSSGIVLLCREYEIDIVHGEASIISNHEVEVKENDENRRITTSEMIIASGSQPLEVEGLVSDGVDILTSKEALELTEIPGSLLVIGGGAIGLELGTMYAKIGSEVTVVEITHSLLPGIDLDLIRVISRSIKKLGINVLLNTRVKETVRESKRLTVSMESNGKEIRRSFDRVLVAIGRVANTQGLGLESIGVELDEKGFIKVDETMKTNVDGVYAIGDVTGPPYLAHKASAQGTTAAENIAGLERRFDATNIPCAIFTHPEIATTGLSESDAIAAGYDISIGKFHFGALGRALTVKETDGLVKVITDNKTKVILGVHIAGPDASDLISEASLAIKMGATSEDIESTIHPHPTLSEAIMEASNASLGRSIHSVVRRSL